MKKSVNLKKVVATMMAMTLALSVTACGSKEEANGDVPVDATETPIAKEIEKPTEINVVIDTVFSSQMEASSWQPWVDKYKELQDIDIKFTKPVHNEYYQQLSLLFTTGEVPDVMEVGTVYYPTYANNGALWNQSEAWENSELKASGHVDEKYVDALRINGELYGFPMTKGNGTITYVRQDWLDNLGLQAPTNYEEFNNMLDQFTNADPDGNGQKDTYGITLPGLINGESPWDIYGREYYQDAKPTFYEKDGVWVDGMLEPEMKAALERMKADFNAGYMDREVVTNKTSTSRDKFYAGQVGVFNYWAGQWNVTMQNNLTAQVADGIVAPIPAIAETQYIERPPTALAITTSAKNPEGIFKYLFEFSHDNGEGEMLFTRGVEGVNYTVENGVYTQLPDVENEKKLYEKAWFDSSLSFTKFEDPITLDERVVSSIDMFGKDSYIEPVPVVNDTIALENPDLIAIRNLAIANAVTTDMSVEDALAQYEQDGKTKIDAILASLNQ